MVMERSEMIVLGNNKEYMLFEYVYVVQIFSFFILIIILILNENINIGVSYYTLEISKFFFLMGIFGVVMCSMYYATKYIQLTETGKHWMKIAYVLIPSVVIIIVVFFVTSYPLHLKVLVLLPVIMSSAIFGKVTGLIVFAVCSLFLLINDIFIYKIDFVGAFEENIVIISLIGIIGWLVGSVIDERKKMEHDLIQTESQFIKIYEHNPVPMAICEIEDLSLVSMNDSFERFCGINLKYSATNLIDLNIYNCNEGNQDIVRTLMNKEKLVNYEVCVQIEPKETRLGLLTTDIINHNGKQFILISINDVTQLRQYEKDMARLERLHLVGEMAAGIGHEIRNPMTTVRGLLQHLSSKEAFTDYKHYCSLMIGELDNANQIITEYLNLARDKPLNMKVQSIASILSNMHPLIKASAIEMGKEVELRLEADCNLLLDEKEIRQLVHNLVQNGLEAMSGCGKLVIGTHLEDNEVVLTVKDQGKGIESSIIEKIGTPFFTTKDYGTGLGLAVCYNIANRHNAKIDIKTGNNGTIFHVRFKINYD